MLFSGSGFDSHLRHGNPILIKKDRKVQVGFYCRHRCSLLSVGGPDGPLLSGLGFMWRWQPGCKRNFERRNELEVHL